MKTSTEYLHIEKLEELTNQLKEKGYEVIVAPGGEDQGLDLLAKGSTETIAFQIKLNDELKESAQEIKRMMHLAKKRGYQNYQLVVVPRPKEKKVQIEGLKETLTDWVRENVPSELSQEFEVVRVERLEFIEVENVDIKNDGINLVGTGAIELIVIDLDDSERDEYKVDFPFNFDVLLGSSLKVKVMNDFQVEVLRY